MARELPSLCRMVGRGARRSALIWIKCADGSRFFKWLRRRWGGGMRKKKREGKRNRLHKKSERRPSSSQEAKKLNSISLLPSYFFFFVFPLVFSFHFCSVYFIYFFPSFHSMGGSRFFLFHFFFFQNNFFFVSYRSRAPAGWQTTKRPPAKPTQTEPKKKKKKQKKLWAKCWIEPIVFFLPPLACAVIITSRRPRQNGSVGTAVLLLLADGERWQRIFDFLRATHTH